MIKRNSRKTKLYYGVCLVGEDFLIMKVNF